MKKNYGFTLAESLISLVILGFIFLALIKVVKTYDNNDKMYFSNGYKLIENIDGAMTNIKLLNKTNLPTGKFITNILGTNTFTLYNDSGGTPSVDNVIALFGKHLKFQDTVDDVCSYTKYTCSNIKGAKIYPNIYVGFEVNSSLINCPDFYLPDSTTAIEVSKKKNMSTGEMETQKCWGKVYIFLDGDKGPGILGKDTFIFGLGETTLAK